MAIKWALLQPGDVLYSRNSNNTKSWTVQILAIDWTEGKAWVSWNRNPAEWRSKRQVEKYYRTPARKKG